MWILIITVYYSATYPSSMAVAEFSDAKACDMARTAWLAKYGGDKREHSAFCFPKSSTIPAPEKKQ